MNIEINYNRWHQKMIRIDQTLYASWAPNQIRFFSLERIHFGYGVYHCKYVVKTTMFLLNFYMISSKNEMRELWWSVHIKPLDDVDVISTFLQFISTLYPPHPNQTGFSSPIMDQSTYLDIIFQKMGRGYMFLCRKWGGNILKESSPTVLVNYKACSCSV